MTTTTTVGIRKMNNTTTVSTKIDNNPYLQNPMFQLVAKIGKQRLLQKENQKKNKKKPPATTLNNDILSSTTSSSSSSLFRVPETILKSCREQLRVLDVKVRIGTLGKYDTFESRAAAILEYMIRTTMSSTAITTTTTISSSSSSYRLKKRQRDEHQWIDMNNNNDNNNAVQDDNNNNDHLYVTWEELATAVGIKKISFLKQLQQSLLNYLLQGKTTQAKSQQQRHQQQQQQQHAPPTRNTSSLSMSNNTRTNRTKESLVQVPYHDSSVHNNNGSGDIINETTSLEQTRNTTRTSTKTSFHEITIRLIGYNIQDPYMVACQSEDLFHRICTYYDSNSNSNNSNTKNTNATQDHHLHDSSSTSRNRLKDVPTTSSVATIIPTVLPRKLRSTNNNNNNSIMNIKNNNNTTGRNSSSNKDLWKSRVFEEKRRAHLYDIERNKYAYQAAVLFHVISSLSTTPSSLTGRKNHLKKSTMDVDIIQQQNQQQNQQQDQQHDQVTLEDVVHAFGTVVTESEVRTVLPHLQELARNIYNNSNSGSSTTNVDDDDDEKKTKKTTTGKRQNSQSKRKSKIESRMISKKKIKGSDVDDPNVGDCNGCDGLNKTASSNSRPTTPLGHTSLSK